MKKQYEHLNDMKCADGEIIYIPYIPVQIVGKGNTSKVEKILKEPAKRECHTKYGVLSNTQDASAFAAEVLKTSSQKEVASSQKEVKQDKNTSTDDYIIMSSDEYKEFGKKRIDESKDSEWQCPTCKHRVKNLQRTKTKDGNPCWGCKKFCDTLDASYFNGKACKLYEEGHSGWVWW